MQLRWQDRTFDELSVVDLYAILALRQRVFVVEQRSPFLDVDGLDPVARHLWAEPETGEDIVAYLRIVPPVAHRPEASLGRIVTAPEVRRSGLGRTLVSRALAALGDAPVRIAAQEAFERFYASFGFRRAGEPYLDAGVPHIAMLRAARTG